MTKRCRVLSRECALLARAFLRCARPLEALDCVWKALRLDPEREEARELLRSAAEMNLSDGPPGPPSPDVRRLQRRKGRVEDVIASDPLVRALFGGGVTAAALEPAAGAATRPDPDAQVKELDRKCGRLKERLEAQRSDKAGGLLTRLEELAARLRDEQAAAATQQAEQPEAAAAEPASDDSSWLYGELSIEHEFHNLANDYYKLERFDEAIACYGIALDIRPDLLETYFNRGLAYTRKCEYAKAHEDLTKVAELNPNLAEAYYTRGLVEEYRQDYDAAVADYDRALEVDPDYAKAKTQRPVALKKRADLEGPSATPYCSGSDSEGRLSDFSRYIQKPDCTFADVAANREAKDELRTVAAFLKGNPAFDLWGCVPPRGVLLFGPPGTGKTLLARALAGETNATFFCTSSTLFLNMYYGNTEQNLRSLFEQAAEVEGGAIIFIDEFDALGSIRSDLKGPRGDDCHNRAVACLLELMDGLSELPNRLVVLAATNALGNIDPAFLRPGRFNYRIEVPRPGVVGLAEVFLIQLERAEARARHDEFMAEDLREALCTPREEWLEQLKRPVTSAHFGLTALAQLGVRHGFAGADATEVIRRCVVERGKAAIRGIDLGPITCQDLLRHANDYIRSCQRAAEDTARGDFGGGGGGGAIQL